MLCGPNFLWQIVCSNQELRYLLHFERVAGLLCSGYTGRKLDDDNNEFENIDVDFFREKGSSCCR